MPATAMPNNSIQLFEQAFEILGSALQTGVKLQGESTRRLTDMLACCGPSEEWQKRTQSLCSDAMSTAQKNVEEGVRVMNEAAARNLDVFQKAFGTGAVSSPTSDMWESAMNAIQANAQAIVQANARVLESWAELGRSFKQTGESMKGTAEKIGERAGEAVEKVAEG